MSFLSDRIDRAVTQAHAWIEASRQYPTPRSAQLLAEVLDHPDGLEYTVAFVDDVIRPEDKKVAAAHLKNLAQKDTSFLPSYLSAPAAIGGRLAPLAPKLAAATANKVFAALVGDLVLDVTPDKLGRAIAKLRADGSRLNLNLLGEAVLGDEEAARRMADTRELIERDDVDYVSLKVSAVIGPHAPFGHAAAVKDAVEKLLPMYRIAKEKNTFINLDMEEYKDLDLTIDVFTRILDMEEFLHYRAGIVLQAYLPDTLERLNYLTQWSQARRARGGAPIKVRIVKGANLSMERVDAIIHGWELTVQPSKCDTDANYLTVLDTALTPERLDAVNIGIAGMNLFTIAFGLETMRERGVTSGVDFEMLSGMATPQSHAIRDTVGSVLYYVPVVRPEEYDVAVAYLVRRLEENATPDNFMSNVFDLDTADTVLLEEQRFRRAADQAEKLIHGPRRKQNRCEGTELLPGVENSRDTDPSLHANIAWAEDIASRVTTSRLGEDIVAEHTVNSPEEAENLVASVAKAAQKWAQTPAAQRAEILRNVAQSFEDHRAELIEVAASEAGKAVDQGDVEVSEAVDFATYYAQLALDLEALEGAEYTPVKTTLITPPWNFPLSIPAGGVLAALASGSGAILKPANLTQRTGAYIAHLMWEAGVPRDVLALAIAAENVCGQTLVEKSDQVILTGSIDTARLFRSWRPNLRLFAETSGKNSIIVTPHADIDLAVKDVVASAFGHAGQKCSAASLVILVGSVGYSRRFQRQLIDAVRSLKLGYPDDLSAQMGPMVEAPHGKLLSGLTTLGEGEAWAIKPRQISDTLWSPGVRVNVKPGSEYHLTEYFGPILGVMRADTLEQAMQWQNAVDFGLTAGIHSLEPTEVEIWLAGVEAGNVYINRTITGAIVRRQPFGGWKRSCVGSGTKAGGPNYLIGLGHVKDAPLAPTGRSLNIPIFRKTLSAITQCPHADTDRITAMLESMEEAIATHFCAEDVCALGVEKNVLRYLPEENVVIRGGDNLTDAIALAVGALAVGATPVLSCATEMPRPMAEFLQENGVNVLTESAEVFLNRAAALAHNPRGVRYRVLDGQADAVAQAVQGSVDVAIYSEPVTHCGRVELLPFLKEQSVSATNHRFGNPTQLLNGIL
ncbi:bifunctional proline dehydrogenase/L-glutamate gamma-semialdehyde dehydrogenase [Schaalia sp. lx-260]|uniref:bifunctional proline dehydrogenase/L-glutamate gamma-semialdehyde dehydrogenase n=1 Tax=Schaalia sp. lx-260 TaxID=2899082 RepID=UPI001E4B8DD6|nr:bifunctional proline dehydrogenase/L-glutamate gamma-semialdehyde dehydrogenase [Schaalia sp. lx-260]MCD4549006.1 bifunctional proline dehydrogenase/L-glutamate gamma-semialdehyde dehydrogenase [Schaalia sp. lx-260]